jgi:hypothetical protein
MAGTKPGHDEKGIIFKWFRNGRASGCEALHSRRDKTFAKENPGLRECRSKSRFGPAAAR